MKITYTLGAAATALALAGPAQAIDVGPGDYTILPGGTNLGMVYWQHLSSDTLKIEGNEIPSSKLEGDVVILRNVNFFELGSMPAAFHLVMPFASLEADIGGVEQEVTNGLGDTTLGLTVWPVQPDNPETGTTLGFSLFATLPTGNFEPGKIGIGEGTTTLTPQLGLIQGLGGGWYFDGVLDVAIKADSTVDGVEYKRDPSWQMQAMLRKQWGPTTSLAIGYSGKRGGDMTVNGMESGLKTESDQLRVFGTHFVSPTVQVQGMLGKDIKVDGGFQNNSVAQFRLVKVY